MLDPMLKPLPPSNLFTRSAPAPVGGPAPVGAALRGRPAPDDHTMDLIRANMGLVRSIARRHQRPWLRMEDLISEGVIGLLKAAQHFESRHEVRFSSYAAWWIRAQIVSYVGSNGRISSMRYGRVARTLACELSKERRRMKRERGQVTDAGLAEVIGVPLDDLQAWRRVAEAEVLPFGQSRRGGYGVVEDSLADEDTLDPERAVAQAEVIQRVRQSLEQFEGALRDERERQLWKHRLVARCPLSQRALGERMGVSKQRVSQLERRLLRRLRDHVAQQLADLDPAR